MFVYILLSCTNLRVSGGQKAFRAISFLTMVAVCKVRIIAVNSGVIHTNHISKTWRRECSASGLWW